MSEGAHCKLLWVRLFGMHSRIDPNIGEFGLSLTF